MKRFNWLLASVVTFTTSIGSAASGPNAFSYEARLYDSTTNLPSTKNVNVIVQVIDPNSVAPGVYCVLREEKFGPLDLSLSEGYFSVAVGTGTTQGYDPGRSMQEVFANAGATTGLRDDGGGACTPVRSGGTARLLRVKINDIAASTTVTLAPDVGIGSTPYAIAADSLQGFAPSDLLQVDNSNNVTQSYLQSLLTGSNYSKLMALVAGTSSMYSSSSSVSAGTKITTSAGTVSSPVAGSIWVDTTSNQLMVHTGSGIVAVTGGGGGGGTVTSIVAGAGLTGGTITGSGTIALDTTGVVGGSYGGNLTVPTFTVDNYGRLTAAGATTLDAAAIATGTLSSSLLPIVPITKGGTGSPTTLNNNRLLYSSGGAIVEAAPLTNGQIFIGQTGGAPVPSTLTAGSGITISNSAGGIMISSSGVGLASVTGSTLVSGKIWIGDNANTAQPVSLYGDVTISSLGNVVIGLGAIDNTKLGNNSVDSSKIQDGTVGTAELASQAVTYAKLQNVSGNNILLGRSTSGAGVVEEITIGANLSLTGGVLSAVAGSGTTGITGLSGDLVASGSGTVSATISTDAVTTSKIANGAVTFSKLQNITTNKLLGRNTAGSGDIEELGLTGPLALSGGFLGLNVGSGLTVTNGTLTSTATSITSVQGLGGGTLTGTLGLPNGTAAAPGVDVGAGLQSGMFFSNTPANRLAFSVTGTEKMHILSTGNVGIGTNNALSKLDVYGNLAISTTPSNRYVFQIPIGAGSQSWIYPSSGGSAGFVLSTDGAGSLSWVSAGGGGGLPLAGGSMTGSLHLAGVPTLSSEAANKAYVDTKLSLSGGSLSGGLTAGSLTLASGGFIRFADGTTMSTSAGTGTFMANGSTTMTGILNVGANAGTPGGGGQIRLYELASGGTQWVGFKAPDSITTSVPWTLPAADGVNGYVLQTNGAGSLSWVSVAGGAGDFLRNGSLSMTGQFLSTVGNATAPGISFGGDTNTGLYLPLPDQLGFSAGGTERLRITAAGSVGIGSTLPQQMLDVAGNIQASGYLATSNSGYGLYQDDGTIKLNSYIGGGYGQFGTESNHKLALVANNLDMMTIMPSGDVGVGTTTPTNRFHVVGGAIVAGTQTSGLGGELRVEGTNSNYIALRAPSSIAATQTWILPSAAGTAGQVLTMNAAGSLSWSSPSAAGLATVSGSTLANGMIWIGNASNVAIAVTPYGNATISNSGQIVINSLSPFTDINGVSATSVGAAIGSMTNANVNSTLVRRDASGGFAAGTITATQITATKLVTSASGFEIGLKHPGSGSYTLMLPTTSGSAGMQLVATGAGTLGWQAPPLGLRESGSNLGAGTSALDSVTVGTGNVGLGYFAGTSLTNGSENTAVGAGALQYEVSGNDNTAIGASALFMLTGGTNNTAIGSGAGSVLTTGGGNILIGRYAGGSTLTTGSNNILIGNQVDVLAGTISNSLNIGNIITGDMGAKRVGINASLDLVAAEPTVYAVNAATLSSPSTRGLMIKNPNGNIGSSAFATFNVAGGSQTAYIGAVSSLNTGLYTPAIVFGQRTGASSYMETMRIETNGKVGIGSNTPTQMLDVAGNVRATNLMMISGGTIGQTGCTTGTIGYHATDKFVYCDGSIWRGVASASSVFSTTGSTANFASADSVVLGSATASISLSGLQVGKEYRLIITNSSGSSYTFGTGAPCTSFKHNPANGATTSTTDTIYKIFVGPAGVCYVDWKTGY